ncbi:MAG: NAD(P)H-dependent oxidoreductase [Vannielia sp.]|uniref:NADPH-dependent FMN reductase n=1 Tax=Vannielia sp. TaxID=2813045 RepID=UPI003B8AE53D
MKSIGVIVGSLREGSLNRKLAEAVAGIASDLMDFSPIEIGELPHYNDDLWSDPPAEVTAFKSAIDAVDGFLFVIPEYNRNLPGFVANALDWGSRPWGKSTWVGKPAAVMSASPGAISGAVAAQHMRMRGVALGMHVMGHPEVYMRTDGEFFSETGEIAREDTAKFLRTWAETFATFAEKF